MEIDSASQHLFEERLLVAAVKTVNRSILDSLIGPPLSPIRNGPTDTNEHV